MFILKKLDRQVRFYFGTVLLMLSSFSYSSVYDQNGQYCQFFKDEAALIEVSLPDSKKSYSMLDSEIKNLEAQLNNDEISPEEAAFFQEQIANKTLIRDGTENVPGKVDYDSLTKELKKAIRKKEIEIKKIEKKAKKLIAEGHISQAQLICSGSVSNGSSFQCPKTNAIRTTEILPLKDSLAEYNRRSKEEQKTITKLLAKMKSTAGNAMFKSKVASDSSFMNQLLGMPTLNINDRGLSNIGVTEYFYIDCEHKPSLKPVSYSVLGVEFTFQKDTSGNYTLNFCDHAFIGTGKTCFHPSRKNESESGWKTVSNIVFNGTTIDIRDDGLLKITPSVNPASGTLMITLKTLTTNLTKDGIDERTEIILSGNPTFRKIAEEYSDPEKVLAKTESFFKVDNDDSCPKQMLDSSNINEDGELTINCKTPVFDKNYKLQYDDAGNVVFADFHKKYLLEKEFCEKNAECVETELESIDYDEGCFSPLPKDQLIVDRTLPQGNCAIKFNKEPYVCKGKRVMDTRACVITRKQEIQQCEESLSYETEKTLKYGKIDDHGKRVWDNPSLYSSNMLDRVPLSDTPIRYYEVKTDSHKKGGDSYISITMLNYKELVEKGYVGFRIHASTTHGRYAGIKSSLNGDLDTYLAISLLDETEGQLYSSKLGTAPNGTAWVVYGNKVSHDGAVRVHSTCWRATRKKEHLGGKSAADETARCADIGIKRLASGNDLYFSDYTAVKESGTQNKKTYSIPYAMSQISFQIGKQQDYFEDGFKRIRPKANCNYPNGFVQSVRNPVSKKSDGGSGLESRFGGSDNYSQGGGRGKDPVDIYHDYIPEKCIRFDSPPTQIDYRTLYTGNIPNKVCRKSKSSACFCDDNRDTICSVDIVRNNRIFKYPKTLKAEKERVCEVKNASLFSIDYPPKGGVGGNSATNVLNFRTSSGLYTSCYSDLSDYTTQRTTWVSPLKDDLYVYTGSYKANLAPLVTDNHHPQLFSFTQEVPHSIIETFVDSAKTANSCLMQENLRISN